VCFSCCLRLKLMRSAKDASEHFSKCLMPYMKHLSSPSSNVTAIRETLDRATIVKAGVLTAPHEWLQPRIEEIRAKKANPPTKSSGDKQKILLLGSGLVAGPAVEVFAARPDVHLVIGQCLHSHPGHANIQEVTTFRKRKTC